MTVLFFLNGKKAGSIAFMPDGTPLLQGGVDSILPRLPVPIFPFLAPASAQRILAGLPRQMTIPRLGVLTIEVLR